MALTDFDFTLTRNEIIQSAFEDVGALSTDQSLTADQFAQGSKVLNAMVQSWQNKHIFLWTLRLVSVDLIAGTEQYAAEDDPQAIDIDSAWIRMGTTDVPIEVISWREYQDIPDKTNAGTPSMIALDARISPTIYAWPVPNDATQDLRYLAICKLKDFDSASDPIDFTTRWLQTLRYGLAVELSPKYGLPLGERQWLEQKFAEEWSKSVRGDIARKSCTVCEGAFENDY